jgi:dihydrodipicolinate synthase/N-acetylneuraminate lyase
MTFFVSLVTPFDREGKVDLPRLRAHVLWLATQGVSGFVPTLLTGELPYLRDREREAVHRTVIDAAGDREVLPCVWDPSPATVSWLARAATDAGAAGCLLPPPLLYDLDDAAIERWYTSLAAVGVTTLALHLPEVRARISPALLDRLVRDGAVAGLGDGSEDPWRVHRLATAHPGAVLAIGDRVWPRVRDWPLRGVVSELANVWPAFCLRVFRTGDPDLEEVLLDRLHRVRQAGGPRVLKALLGMGCRSPLFAPDDDALAGLPPAEGP